MDRSEGSKVVNADKESRVPRHYPRMDVPILYDVTVSHNILSIQLETFIS